MIHTNRVVFDTKTLKYLKEKRRMPIFAMKKNPNNYQLFIRSKDVNGLLIGQAAYDLLE